MGNETFERLSALLDEFDAVECPHARLQGLGLFALLAAFSDLDETENDTLYERTLALVARSDKEIADKDNELTRNARREARDALGDSGPTD